MPEVRSRTAAMAIRRGRRSRTRWACSRVVTQLAFASGMAATAAVLDEVPIGGVVVAPRHAYYGTRNLLAAAPDGRWSIRLVDIADTDATLRACEGADLLFVESPTNPMLEVADLTRLCAGAHERGVLVAVDNTFATPLGQRPLDHGADVVLHSVTKFLAGHADVILGATVTPAHRPDLHQRLRRRRSSNGAIPGPMEVYLALAWNANPCASVRASRSERPRAGPSTRCTSCGRAGSLPRALGGRVARSIDSSDERSGLHGRVRGVRRRRGCRSCRPVDASHRPRHELGRDRDHDGTACPLARRRDDARGAAPSQCRV